MATAGMINIPVMTPMSVSTLRFDQSCPKICIPSRLSVCTATVRVLRTTVAVRGAMRAICIGRDPLGGEPVGFPIVVGQCRPIAGRRRRKIPMLTVSVRA